MTKTMRNFISLLAFCSFFLILVSCTKNNTESRNKENNVQTAVTTIETIDQFNEVIELSESKLLVFDLYADWCMPCKVLEPTFNELSQTHKEDASFYRVNIDKNPDIASAFGVRGIPYVVFIRNKAAIHALAGLNPKEKYESVIRNCNDAESAQACTQILKSL